MPLSSFIDPKRAKQKDDVNLDKLMGYSENTNQKPTYNKERYHNYYKANRKIILDKKKIYNSQPHVKEQQKIYHKAYYLLN